MSDRDSPGDKASSSSPISSPRLLVEGDLDTILGPGWLRVHRRNTNSLKISSNPENIIALTDCSSPVRKTGNLAQDIEDMDENEDDLTNSSLPSILINQEFQE